MEHVIMPGKIAHTVGQPFNDNLKTRKAHMYELISLGTLWQCLGAKHLATDNSCSVNYRLHGSTKAQLLL